jgi:hypothetical protein
MVSANDRARTSGNRPMPVNEIIFQENAQARLNGWVLVPLFVRRDDVRGASTQDL